MKKPLDPNYPAYRYHPTLEPVRVYNQEQAAALAPEWRETPYPPPPTPEQVAAACPDCPKLREELAAVKADLAEKVGKFDTAWAQLKTVKDDLAAALVAAHAEKDALVQQLADMTAGRDRLRDAAAVQVADRERLKASLKKK